MELIPSRIQTLFIGWTSGARTAPLASPTQPGFRLQVLHSHEVRPCMTFRLSEDRTSPLGKGCPLPQLHRIFGDVVCDTFDIHPGTFLSVPSPEDDWMADQPTRPPYPDYHRRYLTRQPGRDSSHRALTYEAEKRETALGSPLVTPSSPPVQSSAIGIIGAFASPYRVRQPAQSVVSLVGTNMRQWHHSFDNELGKARAPIQPSAALVPLSAPMFLVESSCRPHPR